MTKNKKQMISPAFSRLAKACSVAYGSQIPKVKPACGSQVTKDKKNKKHMINPAPSRLAKATSVAYWGNLPVGLPAEVGSQVTKDK